jgi:PAS domain S-box-containing protein
MRIHTEGVDTMDTTGNEREGKLRTEQQQDETNSAFDENVIESRFRTLSDSIPQLIWTNDTLGRANYFNRRWFDFSGLTFDQCYGLGWQAMVHPDDFSHSLSKWESAFATGEIFDVEYRLRRFDGVFRWHIGRNVPLWDAQGEVVAWFGTATDIDDLKRAESAQRESEERFRLLVDGTKDYAMFLMDFERRVVHWNPGAQRLFGYTPQQILGHSSDVIFTSEDIMAGAPQEEAETALRQGSAADNRWHLRRDGSVFWADGLLTSLYYESGQPRGFAKIVRDATAERESREALRLAHDDLELRVQERTRELSEEIARRKQLEEERKRLMLRVVNVQEEERGRISRELHDNLGQHLTAIMLGIQALQVKQGPSSEDGANGTSLASGSVHKPLTELSRLFGMISDLTGIAHRLAWELRPPVLDNVGLEAALQQYVRNFAHGPLKTDFVSRLPEGETGISGDAETALYRVTQEALSNVLRHANATQVSVVLEQRENFVTVIIEDNGQGFDVDAVGDKDRLGLVGMRERLELIDGSLEIESVPEQGTTIYTRAPLDTTPFPR